MGLWSSFLSLGNFQLAFERIERGGNRDYKRFFRHLFPGYRLALDLNLKDLISKIRRRRYHPETPIRIHQPKKSGVLRPLTLLSLNDQIVYQAISNQVANAFHSRQKKYAFDRCFGAIFAGPSSQFFYYSWKRSYSAYNTAIKKSFGAGNRWVADFDLVSFYELIDTISLNGY
jgi:hypothetical protein